MVSGGRYGDVVGARFQNISGFRYCDVCIMALTGLRGISGVVRVVEYSLLDARCPSIRRHIAGSLRNPRVQLRILDLLPSLPWYLQPTKSIALLAFSIRIIE
jgi:hypothetical protein